MIEIVCDKCDKTFDVEDAYAGGKVACPDCGDINRVPEPAAALAAAAAAASATPAPGGASAASRGGGGGEREICTIRPAMFRAHPFRFVLILLLAVGGAAAAIASGGATVWDWVLWPGLVVAALALLWWVQWWIAAHLWIRVVISNKRTVRHEGIVRRHSTEVLHDHVRSVDIQQNFLQRILNVGYIGIDSAGQDGIEIEIRDIPGPYEIKKIIDRYRSM